MTLKEPRDYVCTATESLSGASASSATITAVQLDVVSVSKTRVVKDSFAAVEIQAANTKGDITLTCTCSEATCSSYSPVSGTVSASGATHAFDVRG